eukprot:m.20344 g.20344  ORF g.20344 m.20344 type:complete len:208 (-) comp12904_c0_seq1:390-1013(-)
MSASWAAVDGTMDRQRKMTLDPHSKSTSHIKRGGSRGLIAMFEQKPSSQIGDMNKNPTTTATASTPRTPLTIPRSEEKDVDTTTIQNSPVVTMEDKTTIVNATGTEVSCELYKGSHGFGMRFGGARNFNDGETKGYGILIVGKNPDTASAACDHIKVGWQLVAMDDVDLSQATLSDLARNLRNVGKHIKLKLKLNNCLREAYGIEVT